jgi:hypothetical protein
MQRRRIVISSSYVSGHNWFGDAAAEADPRGGVMTEEQFLAQYAAAVEELQMLAVTRYRQNRRWIIL